jgi:prepilin-type N-terminal cleavage/methylation domain-containing protein
MKKSGFTLAEVLITLAIIGVVAALTIPTVVKNYQKTQTVVKLKKAYSAIFQAYNNSQAENGAYETWDKGIDIGTEEYFNKYWKPYFKIEKTCSTGVSCGYKNNSPWVKLDGIDTGYSINTSVIGLSFITTDGVLYRIRVSNSSGASEASNIIVDLNNSKGPNMLGKDTFFFERTKNGILPYGYSESVSNINSSCSEETKSGFYCAAKIMKDGWEITDSYPWN